MTALEDRPKERVGQPEPGLANRLRWAMSIALSDRRNRGRLATMAVGVGLCALVLLALASAGPTLDRLADRSAARTPAIGADGEGFAYRTIDTTVNGHVIRGRLLQAVPAGSAQPAPPPGADHYPAPGETIVSPRLAELLQLREEQTLRAVLGIPDSGVPAGVLSEEWTDWAGRDLVLPGRSHARRRLAVGAGVGPAVDS